MDNLSLGEQILNEVEQVDEAYKMLHQLVENLLDALDANQPANEINVTSAISTVTQLKAHLAGLETTLNALSCEQSAKTMEAVYDQALADLEPQCDGHCDGCNSSCLAFNLPETQICSGCRDGWCTGCAPI